MERLTDRQLAYAAGYFDSSRGWLDVARDAVGVRASDPALPNLFRLWFGGLVIDAMETCTWSLTGDDARAFLRLIRPYVVLKDRIDAFLDVHGDLGPAAETKSESPIA